MTDTPHFRVPRTLKGGMYFSTMKRKTSVSGGTLSLLFGSSKHQFSEKWHSQLTQEEDIECELYTQHTYSYDLYLCIRQEWRISF